MAINNVINGALADNNITIPVFQKAARAIFGSQAKVDFENDMPVVTIGNLPIVDAIKTYANTDEGKHLVISQNNGGD